MKTNQIIRITIILFHLILMTIKWQLKRPQNPIFHGNWCYNLDHNDCVKEDDGVCVIAVNSKMIIIYAVTLLQLSSENETLCPYVTSPRRQLQKQFTSNQWPFQSYALPYLRFSLAGRRRHNSPTISSGARKHQRMGQ